MARAHERMAQLGRLNADSEEYSALAMVTLGNMREIHFDPEGRVNLPDDLMPKRRWKRPSATIFLSSSLKLSKRSRQRQAK